MAEPARDLDTQDSEQGASEQEAAQRRADMRRNSITGQGRSGDTHTGKLNSASQSTDTKESPASSRPKLTVHEGGKSDGAAKPGAAKPGLKGPGGGFQARLAAIGGQVNQKRKPLIFTLIGVVLALVISQTLFSLVPFKLESMMKNIFQHRVEARIRHFVVKRLLGPRQLMKQYVKASIGNDDATFERNIASLSEPDKQLMREWRKPSDGGDPLEKRLATQQNFSFSKNGNTVDVFQHNAHIGNIDNPTVEATSNSEMFEQIHNFNYSFRRPFRQMAAALYDVVKWRGPFNKENGPDAEKEVTSDLLDDAGGRLSTADTSILECAIGSVVPGEPVKCPDDEGNRKLDERTGIQDVQASQTGGSHDEDVSTAVSDGNTSAVQKAKALYNKVADHVVPGRVFSRILSKFIAQEVATRITAAFAAASGPLIVIAGVDIASRIDHFLWNGIADRVLVQMHKVEYAGQFFLWSSINDNRNDGATVSGDENNAVANRLDGSEKAAASKYIYGTGGVGAPSDNCDPNNQTLTCTSDGAGGVSGSVFSRSIDENAHPIEDWYKKFVILNPAIGSIGFHYMMVSWFSTGGQIWGIINRLIGAATGVILQAIEAIPGFGQFVQWAMDNIGHWLGILVTDLLGAAVDGTEAGADLINGVDAGGAVAGFDFSRWVGGTVLSPLSARQVNQEIADDESAQQRSLSLHDRLFSFDNPRSMVNVLALQMPSSPAGAVSDGMDYVASVGAHPYQALAPLFRLFGVGGAQAANDLPNLNYGLNTWGFTDGTLAQNDHGLALNAAYANAQKRIGHPNVKVGEMTLDDCPEVDPPNTPPEQLHPNLCRLDLMTLQSMNADFTKDDDGGLNSP